MFTNSTETSRGEFMSAWFAGCDGQHGISGPWMGEARTTEAKAQDDADKHKEKYPNHQPSVFYDPNGNAV